jgi:hypothetical protein
VRHARRVPDGRADRGGGPPDLDHAAHRLAQAPARSAWRTLGLVVLRCYLLAAIIVRAIQVALGAR